MQGFPFYDRPMRITYAKTKSDAVMRAEGIYEEDRQKRIEKRKALKAAMDARIRQSGGEPPEKRMKVEGNTSNPAPSGPVVTPKPQAAPPNKILFVENLPPLCNERALTHLFQQFGGFQTVRFLPGMTGKAFVEFVNEATAGQAMSALQHFKITPEYLMVISYAKK